MKLTVEAILSRPDAIGMGAVDAAQRDVITFDNYDSGVYRNGPEFLRSQVHRYRRAILMCDRHGCGREEQAREILEGSLEERLRQSGWEQSAAIVIDPELENWIWVDSPHLDEIVGWNGRSPSLREWLQQRGHVRPGSAKPSDPQAALDEALRIVKKPRSSSVFQQAAGRVSLRRCTDPAFLKFSGVLRKWFPAEPAA